MRKFGAKKIITVLGFYFFVIGFFYVAADSPDFSIGISPQQYGPNDKISVVLTSKDFYLNGSSITWILDGKTVLKGTGEKRLDMIAPDFGKESKLAVAVISEQGIKKEKTAIIRGNGVDLIWKARTSVPAWYKGKALPVLQSKIKVAAIPFVYSGGKEISPSSLVYEWYVNNKKDIPNSGMGKRSYIFQIKNSDDYVITVKVSDGAGNIKLEKGTVISVDRIDPVILFYEENPLEGTQYQSIIGREINFDKEKMGARAEAYFFSADETMSWNYKWSMNGREVNVGELPNLFFFRRGNEPGISEIKLKINNTRSVLQMAENFFRVNY